MRISKKNRVEPPVLVLAAAYRAAAAAATVRLRRAVPRRRGSGLPATVVGTGGAHRLRRLLVRAVVSLAFAQLAFILSTSLSLLIFRTVDPGATNLMLYRKLAYGWTIKPPHYVPLIKIPKTVRSMAIRVEDGTFYEHHGFLPAAIKHAWVLNQRIGAPVYGGSTITMQTARTLFLIPEKSYLRKYLELIIALEMEVILGKDRILELYFNYAEWGKGVFGIDAASRHHYKAGIAAIDRDQALRLITLLSSPIRYGPYNFQKNGILQSRYEYLLSRFAP